METVAAQWPCPGARASACRSGAKIGPVKERPSALWTPASDGSIRSEKQPEVDCPVQIFIRTIEGRSVPFKILLSQSVADLKLSLQEYFGIPDSLQLLLFEGRALRDEQNLSEYKLYRDATIHMSARLRGGMARAGSSGGPSYKEATAGVKNTAPATKSAKKFSGHIQTPRTLWKKWTKYQR